MITKLGLHGPRFKLKNTKLPFVAHKTGPKTCNTYPLIPKSYHLKQEKHKTNRNKLAEVHPKTSVETLTIIRHLLLDVVTTFIWTLTINIHCNLRYNSQQPQESFKHPLIPPVFPFLRLSGQTIILGLALIVTVS